MDILKSYSLPREVLHLKTAFIVLCVPAFLHALSISTKRGFVFMLLNTDAFKGFQIYTCLLYRFVCLILNGIKYGLNNNKLVFITSSRLDCVRTFTVSTTGLMVLYIFVIKLQKKNTKKNIIRGELENKKQKIGFLASENFPAVNCKYN